MNHATTFTFVILACALNASCVSDDEPNEGQEPSEAGPKRSEAGPSDGSAAVASFFVSSDKSATGNLGGLTGADARCERLARAAGLPSRTWKAYLSAEGADGGTAVDARDRIGSGPWYNVKGALVASDLAALHARTGDAEVFLDEHGSKIPGQWAGSPTPVEHDILTGSNADGTVLPGTTCEDWTSDSTTLVAQVGHSDGLGPGMSATPPYPSWNSVHTSQSCNDTAPRGGAGRIYCFAAD